VTSRRRRLSIWLIAILSSVVLLIASSAWIVGSKLVGPANHGVQKPTGFDAQTLSIPGSGHSIAAWWSDAGDNSPVVLLLHAVRADRSTMVTRAQLLKKHGFSVLLIDLQAHGETPGNAITLGAREASDVVAARDWLKRTMPSRRVGVVGCSLGGASVLLGPQPAGFDAVVLEAVYPRISRAVENRVRIRLGRLAPIVTPLLLMQLNPRLGLTVSDLEPIRFIGKLGAPVLIVAGESDEHTTLQESQELYAAAASPKGLWIVPRARHQDFLAYQPAEYEARVVSFLTKTLMSPPPFIPRAMSRGEFTQWLIKTSPDGRQTRFEPYDGKIPCCDLEIPELRFLPNQQIEVFAGGYVADIRTVPFRVQDDGRIELAPGSDSDLAEWLRGKDLHDMLAIEYGSDVYLVKYSESAPDFFFEQRALWPFKYFADKP
jgi:alpha-beta hydrolase superfamily lysophospholipase